jgi:hypothetical protein
MDLVRFAVGSTAAADRALGESDIQIDAQALPTPNYGTAIIPVTTPGDITRIRLGVHWRARNPLDGYAVSASFDGGQTWKEIGRLDLGNSAKSTYLIFSDVPTGSRAVQIKFDGTQKNATEIFDLRIDVDYKEPAGGFRPVKVTYAWEEGVSAATAPAPVKGKKPMEPEKPHGILKTAEHICTGPTDQWTIHCGQGTVPKSYTVELAK